MISNITLSVNNVKHCLRKETEDHATTRCTDKNDNLQVMTCYLQYLENMIDMLFNANLSYVSTCN